MQQHLIVSKLLDNAIDYEDEQQTQNSNSAPTSLEGGRREEDDQKEGEGCREEGKPRLRSRPWQ
jgi:hypothetical protein